jgi:hypothetical protein
MKTKGTEPRTNEITSVCWAEVPPSLTSTWAIGAGMRLAVWPAPVDHDACLSDAGFTEFADSGARWDDELEEMTATLV